MTNQDELGRLCDIYGHKWTNDGTFRLTHGYAPFVFYKRCRLCNHYEEYTFIPDDVSKPPAKRSIRLTVRHICTSVWAWLCRLLNSK